MRKSRKSNETRLWQDWKTAGRALSNILIHCIIFLRLPLLSFCMVILLWLSLNLFHPSAVCLPVLALALAFAFGSGAGGIKTFMTLSLAFAFAAFLGFEVIPGPFLETALTLAFAFNLALAFAFGVASTESAPGAASVQASGAAAWDAAGAQLHPNLLRLRCWES